MLAAFSGFIPMLMLFIGMHLPVGMSALPARAAQADSLAAQRRAVRLAPASVVLWNRTIVVFRSAYEELTPQARATYAMERLNQLPANLPEYRVVAVDVFERGRRMTWVRVNGRVMFGLIEGEQDQANGETYEAYKQKAVRAVSDWLYARREQYRLPLFLRAVAIALLATIVATLAVIVVGRAIVRLLAMLRRLESGPHKAFVIGGIDVAPYLLSFAAGLAKVFELALIGTIAYVWLAFVLSHFPYTRPWALGLSGYLFGLISDIGQGFLGSIPGVMTVCVIYLVTRQLVNVINGFFRGIESGVLAVRWFEPETAKATRRIIVVLVWIFALIIAYPLIPGSETKAFQGVSVFLGLMLSLGSAGLVGQLIGGIVAVYTKAFQAGDYVKIGEHEGVVKELGLLAAKIVTVRKEEVTIPNALLMSTTTINYTRQSRTDGAIVASSVTIGYDAPWRQVHAMLLIGAERTEGILRSPGSFVLQQSLSDSYVEYTLMFRIERPEERYLVLSELHGHIQDVFNEYGVQIMSPNFVMQPDKEVVVPKERWYAKPAAGPGSQH